MSKLKNTLFWRKLTAVLGIFAIINSMIVAVPIAFAVPTAANGGVVTNYTANDTNKDNVTVIKVAFSEALTDAGSGVCGPSVCYNTVGATLGGTAWDGLGSIATLMRNPGDATELLVFFDQPDMVTDFTSPTITFDGFGGITSPQQFSIPAPLTGASNAVYTAAGPGGNSILRLAFTGALNLTDNASACPASPPAGTLTCFDKDTAIDILSANLAIGATVTHLYVNTDDDATVVYALFDRTAALQDVNGTVTFNANFAGVTTNQTFQIDAAVVEAVSAITTVTAADNDTAFFGLDGNDFSVSWVAGAAPDGFTQNRVYIVPNATSLTAANVDTTGCGGGVCNPLMFFDSWAFTMAMVPPFYAADSEGTAWDEGTSYKACIVTTATADTIKCSNAFSVTSDIVADDASPFVDHFPTHTVVNDGSSDVVFYAAIDDAQTTESQFNNTSDGGGEYFKLKMYKNGNWNSALDAVQVNGSLFKFTLPFAAVPEVDSTLSYYLVARDADGNTEVVCADFASSTEAACQSTPFVANVVNADSTVTVAGTVTTFGGSNVEGATVLPGGLAAPSSVATTAANGTYSMTVVSGAYDFVAYKVGYCDNSRFEIVGSNKSGVDISINDNECFNDVGDGDGGSDRPFVFDSIPWPGQFNVDPSTTFMVTVSKAMDATTINDSDPTDADDNVYLTSDDGTTKIAGRVTYCANSESTGCSALSNGQSYVILFDPTSNLSAGQYTLVITQAVLGSAGRSIDGNRPNGGYEMTVSVGSGAFDNNTITTNFGQSGAYMPPYVEAMIPQPGFTAPTNTKIGVKFNQAIDSSTISESSVKLLNSNNDAISVVRTLSTDGKRLQIAPSSNLTEGEYRLQIFGSVANVNGITLLDPSNASSVAFEGYLNVGSSADSTAPTVYPYTADGGGIAVNEPLRFGFSEAMDESTLTFLSGGITLRRGSTNISANVSYDPGSFELTVQPTGVLSPNTAVTLSFVNPTVKDLSGNSMASGTTFTYTTGGLDTTAPTTNGGSGCDDYKCRVSFNEPMNHDSQAAAAYANSVLNPANYALVVNGDPVDLTANGVTFIYQDNGVDINGLNLIANIGNDFVLTVTGVQDLSGNGISTSNDNNVVRGVVQNSANTFGSFGDDNGRMFGPPTAGGGNVGEAFDMNEQIGGFSIADFFGGAATMVFPFNNMAGVDSDVMQVRFSPGVQLQDGDQVIITLPAGTDVTNAIPDAWSPFKNDFNEQWGSGTVTFDNTFDTDGISVNTSQRKVTVQLDITTGSTGANDFYTIDLKGITNPPISRGPSTSGYTATVKLFRSNSELYSQQSMPYFIEDAGSNTINLSVCAGSCDSPDNVAGDLYIWGGGPMGGINKKITLASGAISKVNDVTASSVSLTSLPDGCYFIGMDPSVTLSGTDYFGANAEDTCVSGGETVNVTKVLTSSASSANAPITVKLAGISDFGGADIDIFAGGPGNFVVKSLTGVDAPDPDGYTLRLSTNGNWFVGVGPGMSKGSSATSAPTSLPGVPPSNAEIRVSNIDSTPVVKGGLYQPNGVSFDDDTDTITFTFAAADKAIAGTVKDGSGNALSNVDIMIQSQGFSAPIFTQTAQDGTFTGYVSDYGSYRIQANKPGISSFEGQIEIKPDGVDVGSSPDIFFKGKQITVGNPFIIKLKKPNYSIAGKVLDSSGNAISYAPLRAQDANGLTVWGGTDSTGNYTVFVDSGTWTLTAELPPSQTEECGTYTKTVTITSASKSSQNIEPSSSTCYTLSGTITVAGAAYQGPVMIQSWDLINDVPAGGVFKPTSTNSSGAYQAKVPGNTDLKIFTWDPSYGELSATVSVATSNATKNITTGSASPVTLTVTGGTSDMKGSIEFENITSGARKFENLQDFSAPHTINLLDGSYNYRIQLDGIEYSGTVSGGGEIAIDTSAVSRYTYSGTVVDANASELANVAITFYNATDKITKTLTTDANGAYTGKLPGGSWEVSAALANYVPSQKSTITLSADSADNTITLTQAASTIEGIIYKSNGSTPATGGFVAATNSATGVKSIAQVDATDGSYSIPVANGSWTLEAKAPGHAKTSFAGGAVVISSAGATTGKNITLTADSGNLALSSVKQLAGSSGGTMDDTDNTGVKVSAGANVLTSEANTNVNITIEKNFDVSDTTNALTLGNAGYDFSASDGTNPLTEFNGNVGLSIDYTALLADLPTGYSESDIKFGYEKVEAGGELVDEGNYTKDTVNHIITANTSHFTTFALFVPASVSSGGGNAVSGGSTFSPTNQVAVVDGEIVTSDGSTECTVESVEGSDEAVSNCDASSSEDAVAPVEEEKTYVEVDEDANTITYLVPPVDTYEVAFTDIGHHWAKDIISELAGRGIVDGYNVDQHKEFKPNKGMTRAELVKAVVRSMELPVPMDVSAADLGYYDVKADSQYAPYIYAAQKAGIVSRGALFRPNAVVNRAEALKIILLGAKVDLADYPDGMILPFSDVARDAWFRNNLKYAFFHGIIGGYNSEDGKKEFRGANEVTRAEATKMLSSVFAYKDKDSIGEMLKASLFGIFRR